MASLRQARGLGAVGSLLLLASPIQNAAVFSIVGLILILFAVKYISEVLDDRDLYGSMTSAVIIGIVGEIVGLVFVYSAIYSFVGSLSTGANTVAFYNLVTSTFIALLVVWICFLVSADFIKKTFDSISESLDLDLFRTAGRLFFVGGLLVIVPILGFIILLIASAISTAAFLALPDEKPSRPKSTLSTLFPRAKPGTLPGS